MSSLRQVFAVVDMNLRSLPHRLGASLVIVLGTAGVVGVLISVLALATGLKQATAGAGSPDRAIILSGGALAEGLSSIPRDAVPNIISAPGIAKDGEGRTIADPEVLAQVQVHARGSGKLINLTLRGVGVTALELRPELHLIAGRMFQSGLHELIVGRNAQAQYSGLDIGSRVSFQNSDWLVVGTFASIQPSLLESELLADAPTLLSAFQRSWFQSITARLAGPSSLKQLKSAIAADPTLRVDIQLESDYAAAQSRGLSTVLNVIAYFIGGMMAAGALFGALNTLYAAVSKRALEIAQLRAIGFGAAPVVISVLSEALLLSLAGALVGALIAWLLFNGHVTSMVAGGGAQTQMAFTMAVTPGLIVLGVIWGLVIGFVGGLFPAIRAARLPVARALTALA
jgi:putative ABC transport system permease protein